MSGMMNDPAPFDVSTTLDDDDILALVQSGSRRLDRQLRRRDWRELVGGAVAAVVIAPATIRGPMLARAGAILIIVSLLLIAMRLYRARRIGGSGALDMSLSIADALRAERQRMDAQISLLETVAWWYVAPLSLGAVMIVAGDVGASWFTLGYVVLVSLIAWGVIAMNARAVRRSLRPQRDQLSELLSQLDQG